MYKKYVCHNQSLTENENKVEELFNAMAEKDYRYVGSFPADCGGSGRIYSMNHIFEKIE